MSNSAMIQRYQVILAALPDQTQLIAVSKYTSNANIEALMQAGQCDFGEARPQNLRDRATLYPDAHWHMIGPLQKNKAKYVAKFAHMWHSLCDVETAQAVAKHVQGRVLPVLIQVNISGESQKQGVEAADLPEVYAQIMAMKSLQVVGLMGMAAQGEDARPAFALLQQCRDHILADNDAPSSLGLCMGMSNDWRVAIAQGATMVRIGTEIFGKDKL